LRRFIVAESSISILLFVLLITDKPDFLAFNVPLVVE